MPHRNYGKCSLACTFFLGFFNASLYLKSSLCFLVYIIFEMLDCILLTTCKSSGQDSGLGLTKAVWQPCVNFKLCLGSCCCCLACCRSAHQQCCIRSKQKWVGLPKTFWGNPKFVVKKKNKKKKCPQHRREPAPKAVSFSPPPSFPLMPSVWFVQPESSPTWGLVARTRHK